MAEQPDLKDFYDIVEVGINIIPSMTTNTKQFTRLYQSTSQAYEWELLYYTSIRTTYSFCSSHYTVIVISLQEKIPFLTFRLRKFQISYTFQV